MAESGNHRYWGIQQAALSQLRLGWCEEDHYVALFHKEHRLAALEQVPVKQLFDEDLVLFKSHEGIDQDVVKVMEYVEMDKVPKYTSNSDFTVIRLTEQLGFVALIPELIAKSQLISLM